MMPIFLFLYLLIIPCIAFSDDIVDIRMASHLDKTRIVLEITGDASFQARTADKPNRIEIFLPKKIWVIKSNTKPIKPILSINHMPTDSGLTKISLPIENTHIINSAFLIKGSDKAPHRLVIDITPSNKIDFAKNLSTKHGPLKIEPSKKTLDSLIADFVNNPTPTPIAKPKPVKKIIVVIDAGHGGNDPGAHSPSGIKEKQITLSLAKKIARIFNQTGRYDAHLTRSNDRYIKLYNRVKIARKANADLFISIHADSVGNKKTSGASVYTLSNTASDKQTEKLAARENQADLIGGIDLNIEDKDVSAILIDLSMRETMNQSKILANNVIKNLRTSGIHTLKGPHRYAGFAVLKAPDVPSILIETGFVSNEREAKKLLNPTYQSQFAKTLLKSIDMFFSK